MTTEQMMCDTALQDRNAFTDSWNRLNLHVERIPLGWQRLYGELRFRLAVISCSKRCTIRIDGGWEEDGLLQVQSETTDRVVQGLLRKAREKAMHTCMECGKPGKLRELVDWQQATLCGECAGPRLLALDITSVIALARCGSVDLAHELQFSPRALLIRAAAEAAAIASNPPTTFALDNLDSDSMHSWLQELRDRAQQEGPT
ncbi:hypothetical protein HHL11_29990 [Ramlibacter sp. G-1-2-2]|uniref:Uncharacterized protein n=1 Tax=Ramlibacter agri TaxID=2728837 RepID=A0A848HC33_9BURK|nr:hypothetical protein [Ramlibacter agri]NML48017.1 hypothetical protein [Ramlibacter agri]